MVKTIYTDGDYELELSTIQTQTGRQIQMEIRNPYLSDFSETLSITLCPYEDIDELVEELQQKQKAILFLDEMKQNEEDEKYEKQQNKKTKNK